MQEQLEEDKDTSIQKKKAELTFTKRHIGHMKNLHRLKKQKSTRVQKTRKEKTWHQN